MQITQEVRNVLAQAETQGEGLRLAGQLDRKLYVEVNKVLEAIGGKWNRKLGCHVFDEPVEPMIEDILLTGEYRRVKQDLGQFDTPDDLAAYAASRLDIHSGMLVLEPNGGKGNLVQAALDAGADTVHTYELDPKRVVFLCGRFPGEKVVVAQADFLQSDEYPIYHRVLMNPPFAGQADIDHVTKALKCLLPGGKLVAIMSAGVTFRTNAKAVQFRELVTLNGGSIEHLPEDAFKTSGTSVNTVLVTMTKVDA